MEASKKELIAVDLEAMQREFDEEIRMEFEEAEKGRKRPQGPIIIPGALTGSLNAPPRGEGKGSGPATASSSASVPPRLAATQQLHPLPL